MFIRRSFDVHSTLKRRQVDVNIDVKTSLRFSHAVPVMFIECPRIRELWEWLRGMVVTIEPDSLRWQDQQLLNLNFPTTPHARAISYLTMTTVKKMWDFIRQHRQLSVNRMTALIRNDLKIRQQMNLPDVNVNL